MEKTVYICQSCLSTDRQLVSTARIRAVLRLIKYEELDNTNICWECESIIMKFYRFRIQVYNVQLALCKKVRKHKTFSKLLPIVKHDYDFEFKYNSDPLKYNHIEENSKQKVITQGDCMENRMYGALDHGKHTQYLTLDRSEKTEECIEETEECIEETEECTEETEKCIEETEECPTFDLPEVVSEEKQQIFADRLKNCKEKLVSKVKRSLKQVKKKVEEDDLGALKKYETVVLTEEDMIRSREEKRNHPNYKKIPYKCDTCVLGFTTKDNFHLHFEKNHNETVGPHVCDVCATRFATASSLHWHRKKHFVHYSCTICIYKTSAVKAAVNHCIYKHKYDEVDRIHCKQCASVFRTSEQLEEHTRAEHTVQCHDCGEKFKGKRSLRTHQVRIHRVKREFVCDVCTKSFLTKSRLESHMIKHSQTLAQRLAYCALCGIQYKDLNVYRNHLRNSVRHAQNRFQCPECGKKFASKVYWTKHFNFYHLKKSRYNCEDCDKLFISDWRLKNHRQKHHGLSRSRNHGCDDCGKKFYTLSTLRGHQLTHSERRQYMCENCGDTFKQRPALYTHARLVHKEGRKKGEGGNK